MQTDDFAAMSEIELNHWWFRGTRQCFEVALKRSGLWDRIHGRPALDAGCGTGGNLMWLSHRLECQPLWGFDASSTAVKLTLARGLDATVFEFDLSEASSLGDEIRPHLILSSDVLYCIDRRAGEIGLQKLCDRLPAGGCLLLHLPACQWLFSDHDAAVGTLQRYARRDVETILRNCGLTIEFLTYRMALLLPLLLLNRMTSILQRRMSRRRKARSELTLPSRLINSVLSRIVSVENLSLRAGLRFPIGSSLIAVGRKP